MKVLLSNPPWFSKGKIGVRAGSRWPHLRPLNDGYRPFPFFLAYTSSLLKREGLDVKLIDAIAEGISYEQFFKCVESYSPHIALIEVSPPSIDNDLEVARELKKRQKEIFLIFAGPYSRMYQEEFLQTNPFIDLIICGEYEHTMLNIVNALKDNKSFSEINGIIYRSPKGIFKTSPAYLISNLDKMPFPDRDSLPIYKYYDLPSFIPQPPGIIWSSRGCPYGCSFCLWNWVLYGKPCYRKRSVANVIEEMKLLIDKYNFASIYFDDDLFNIDQKWLREFAKRMKEEKIKVPWAIMARAGITSFSTWELLKECGLVAVKFGIESCDYRLLCRYRKDISLEKSIAEIQFLKSLGIKIHLSFMIGPFDDEESLSLLWKGLDKMAPHSAQISYLIPFPGTPFYNEYSNNTYFKKYLKTRPYDNESPYLEISPEKWFQ